MDRTNNIIRVLIADDHEVNRLGLRAILGKALDIQIVGEAQNGAKARQLVTELGPDVLLLDLPMPATNPSAVANWVREQYPDTIVLVLAEYDHDAYLSHMIDAGVAGYILKSNLNEALIVDAILRVVQGESLVTENQMIRASVWHKNVGERWYSLDKCERQVAHLLVRGSNDASIAERLGVKTKAAEFHILNVMKKLELSSRLEVAVWVYEHLPEDLRGNP